MLSFPKPSDREIFSDRSPWHRSNPVEKFRAKKFLTRYGQKMLFNRGFGFTSLVFRKVFRATFLLIPSQKAFSKKNFEDEMSAYYRVHEMQAFGKER